jgi:hypothetical protein
MKRVAAALILFGISFGYVEASVVVYLRTLYDPLRAQLHPGSAPGELFPMMRLEQFKAAGPQYTLLLAVEVGREAATLAMLAAVALAFAKNAGQWLAGFAVAFGVWDIFFYAFLKLMIGWPASLFTWDILFLIPVPWASPVLAPVLVSAAMITAGLYFLARSSGKRPVRAARMHWAAIVAGGLIIILSFTLDWRNLMAGGMPAPFPWWIFGLGLAIGIGTFVDAARRR